MKNKEDPSISIRNVYYYQNPEWKVRDVDNKETKDSLKKVTIRKFFLYYYPKQLNFSYVNLIRQCIQMAHISYPPHNRSRRGGSNFEIKRVDNRITSGCRE